MDVEEAPVTSGQQAGVVAYDSERDLLRALLKGGAMAKLSLPPALEAAFFAHQDQYLVDHIRDNGKLIFPLIMVGGALPFLFGLVPANLISMGIGLVFVVLAMAAIVVTAAYTTFLRVSVRKLIAGMAVISHCLILIATTYTSPGDLLYIALISILVMFTIGIFTLSNLMFRPAALCVLLANLLFIALVVILNLDIEWAPLVICNAGSGFVGLLIGYSQELRDRNMFLQGRALLLENQVVESMAKELEALSRTDALTGLMNRRYFEETLAREWAACRRAGSPMGLLFIDVDHFKGYNDHYGHPAGDSCLKQVAQALQSRLSRTSDVVARYGGEEFVAVLPATDADAVARMAARILQAVDELRIPHAASSCADTVTVSIGVAVLVPDHQREASALLQQADEALYEAKRGGRHRYVFSGSAVVQR